MKYQELEKYFLCGIAKHGEVYEFSVGIYNEKRESFSFPNGSYGMVELFKAPVGSSATYVAYATPLQAIDDADLLYNNPAHPLEADNN